jgi:lipoprotein-anchoring transpeptidase ErfK/SrfK
MLATTACGMLPLSGGAKKKEPADLAVAPDDGGMNIQPDRPISIQVRNGTLQAVTVRTKGSGVPGQVARDGRHWRSRWTLKPNSNYEIMVTALGRDGRTKSAVSSFKTLRPQRTFRVALEAPNDKEKVGVGMPIVLNFDRPITDKAKVERALEVRMSRPVEGAWHWDGKQRVMFRTKDYWPSGQQVHVIAHLSGLQGAKNVYGSRDTKARFQVGDKVVSKINTDSHQMVVRRNGKKARKMAISAGKADSGQYATTSGVHLAMSMEPHVVMTSPGIGPGSPGYYSQDVDDAVRISNSGEYVHGAPWSVGSQGSANVSHGCVNASPDDADWFREMTHRGDIIEVKGTERDLEWNNGWGYWQKSWTEWLKGSALGRSINPGASVPEPRPKPAPARSTSPAQRPAPSTSSSAPASPQD